MVGKIMDTQQPFHRIDTLKYTTLSSQVKQE